MVAFLRLAAASAAALTTLIALSGRTADLPEDRPAPPIDLSLGAPFGIGGAVIGTGAFAAAPAVSPFEITDPEGGPAPNPKALARAAAFAAANDQKRAALEASALSDPVDRLAFAWVSLRASLWPSYADLAAFGAQHPDWPAIDWVRAEQESRLYVEPPDAADIVGLFGNEAPFTPVGGLALAKALRAVGRNADAVALARRLWRENDLAGWLEPAVLKDFASDLTKDDDKRRADRLLYSGEFTAALRAASRAGADVLALEAARMAAARGLPAAALIAATPPSLRQDPGLILAEAQEARRVGKFEDAALALQRAPRDVEALVDPDAWWEERRQLARKLLDKGEAKLAYQVVVDAQPASLSAQSAASFRAGWIALRFLADPALAAQHFAAAFATADQPRSLARAAYWRGQAADALGDHDAARGFYASAAEHSLDYYGQLASRRLDGVGAARRVRPALVLAAERNDAVKVIERLYQAGLDSFATPLAFSEAERETDETQIAALAEVLATYGEAAVNLAFGRIVTDRGLAADDAAFPFSGVPPYSPLGQSADAASVFAVVRQESAFIVRAASGAGAKGLMQVLPSTARDVALKAGVPFDAGRLISDGSYNMQLGAAYLGQLIEGEGGSIEIALAAYNAGPGRVQQWLNQYGDPRRGQIDMVDWVESIPFDETREYVQRVSEALAVYRQRMSLRDAQRQTLRVAGD